MPTECVMMSAVARRDGALLVLRHTSTDGWTPWASASLRVPSACDARANKFAHGTQSKPAHHIKRVGALAAYMLCAAITRTAQADSPFATNVVDFQPAPGQFVNHPQFNDPDRALGPPAGGGVSGPDNTSCVSLGGFGGSITLAFDHTVADDPLNPFGLDAIVFGNAYWVGADPARHWAECATIEISRDVNGDGQPGGEPDEPWFLIPGSHLTDPPQQYAVQTWDDDIADDTYPPASPDWLPPGVTGQWDTAAYELPSELFGQLVIDNPSDDAALEGIYGYADFTPTLVLGDLDADDVVDDTSMTPDAFYTVPDDPLTVGISPESGGGDAFDIAWAIDPLTGEPANLIGFDFIRITGAVYAVSPTFGEKSPEIDAVADVSPDPFGDYDSDGDIDLADFAGVQVCFAGAGAPPPGCEVLDRDGDGTVDATDVAAFVARFTGPMS